jgi:hypothetical protein
MAPIVRSIFPKFPVNNAGGPLGPNPVNGGGNIMGGLGGAPVSFTANATLSVGQQNIPLNAQTLQSGFRSAYFIDEVRMSVVTPTAYNASSINGYLIDGLLGLVTARFFTGSYAFSACPIPIGLYAPVLGGSPTPQNGTTAADYGAYSVGPVGADTEVSRGSVRWVLPVPLYVNAGDVLQCLLGYLQPAIVTAMPDVKVTVTYVGRFINPGSAPPSAAYVPWVGLYSRKFSEGYGSTNEQLRNPFLKNWTAQRFTSRIFIDQRMGSGMHRFLEVDSTYGMYNPVTPYWRVKMSDSMGYAIVPRATPVGSVFDLAARRAWTFNRDIAAREQVNLDVTPVNALTAINGTADLTLNVALVGYREEHA